ncbi:hypothetical protein ROS217_15300 [Roseovarius sp. 217]|nr:hypothetical protein ROS217_15300 [Roseovarius sp. 217]
MPQHTSIKSAPDASEFFGRATNT